jgi:hypothetical protein
VNKLLTNAEIIARCRHAIGHLRNLEKGNPETDGAEARSIIDRVIRRLEHPDQAHETLGGGTAEIND